MSTWTVSIGRNIGTGEPLPREDWTKFQARIEEEIRDLPGVQIFFAGRGGGVYEGVYEESATWIFTAEPPEEHPRAWGTFEKNLAWWAGRYGQDSIAVTRGVTEFVSAIPIHKSA